MPKATSGSRSSEKKLNLTLPPIACCGHSVTKPRSPISFRKRRLKAKVSLKTFASKPGPPDVKRAGNWMWENNPFKDTPEFRGLKILMVMINNWDMKDDNNEILAMRGDTTGEGELRYIISDLGGYIRKDGRVLLAQSQRAF